MVLIVTRRQSRLPLQGTDFRHIRINIYRQFVNGLFISCSSFISLFDDGLQPSPQALSNPNPRRQMKRPTRNAWGLDWMDIPTEPPVRFLIWQTKMCRNWNLIV